MDIDVISTKGIRELLLNMFNPFNARTDSRRHNLTSGN